MKRFHRKVSFALFLVVLALTLTACGNRSIISPTVTSRLVTNTPASTATPIQPTKTATFTNTPIPTATATTEPTNTSSPTATSLPESVTIPVPYPNTMHEVTFDPRIWQLNSNVELYEDNLFLTHRSDKTCYITLHLPIGLPHDTKIEVKTVGNLTWRIFPAYNIFVDDEFIFQGFELFGESKGCREAQLEVLASVFQFEHNGPWEACPDAGYLSQLDIGDIAYVGLEPPSPNGVREEAHPDSTILGEIQPGERVEILDGPECNRYWVWWYVRSLETDLEGWTPEGGEGYYWVLPDE